MGRIGNQIFPLVTLAVLILALGGCAGSSTGEEPEIPTERPTSTMAPTAATITPPEVPSIGVEPTATPYRGPEISPTTTPTPVPTSTLPAPTPTPGEELVEPSPSPTSQLPTPEKNTEVAPKKFREYLEFNNAGWHLKPFEETDLGGTEGASVESTSREVGEIASDNPVGFGWSPQRKVATDSSGNLYITVIKRDFCSGHHKNEVFVYKSTDGGASWFEAPADGGPIACFLGHNQRVGSIAIDSQDRIHVVWYGSENPISEPNHRQVRYSQSVDGGRTWTDPKNISNTRAKTNEHPMLSVGENDELYVTWDRRSFTRSLDHGETWDKWSRYSDTGGSSRSASVVLSNGDIWVVRSGVDVVRSTDGGKTWSGETRISHDDCDGRHSSVIRDSKDRVHVVWRSFCEAEGTSQIRYSMYDGSSWSTPELVSKNSNAFQFFPSITRDAHDNLYVAFIETEDYLLDLPYDGDDPSDGRIYVVANTGDGWEERYRVSSSEAALFPNWTYDNDILPGDPLYLAYQTISPNSHQINVVTVVPMAGGDASHTSSTDGANDLVAHWEFEEASGTVAHDSSPYGNVGMLVNGATWVSGIVGQAVSFDGQDDLIEIRTSQWNTREGTIALWVKARSFSGADEQANYIFGHTTHPPYDNRIQLYIDSPDGNLMLGIGDSHPTHGNIVKLNTGVWYHITLTWDGTDYKVYVYGELMASGTYTGLSARSSTAHIGNNGGEGDEPFNGIIDNVQVYNHALNQEKILRLSGVVSGNQSTMAQEGV